MVPSTKAPLFWLFFLGIEILLIGSSVGFIHTPLWVFSTPLSRSHTKLDILVSPIQRGGHSNHRCFVSETVLFGILPGLPFQNRKFGAIEAGVQTALVLGNKQQRAQWKKDIREKFPFIPADMLSKCVDDLASAFNAIAPKKLRKALKDGELGRVRSKMKAELFSNLETQPMIQKLPIPKAERDKLLRFLVDYSLDLYLKDLEPYFAAPLEKLRVLDDNRREILNSMSVWGVAWYRLRHKSLLTIGAGLLSLWAIYTTLFILWIDPRHWHAYTQHSKSFVSAYAHQFKSFFAVLAGTLVRAISNAQSAFSSLI